jgi:protein gp37
MAMWHPWRGCKKIQEGCRFCYIHEGDKKKQIDTTKIIHLKTSDKPIRKTKKGTYEIPSGRTVYLCFSSDFLIEEADEWRQECWDIMKERTDVTFVFLTKRMHRFEECKPTDWGELYNHVQVGVSVSTQAEVDQEIPYLVDADISHKTIVCQPLIERLDLTGFLPYVDTVIVGGEHGKDARPLEESWVYAIREQCIQSNTTFEFRQTGSFYIRDGVQYTIPYRQQASQAKKANLNYTPHKGAK